MKRYNQQFTFLDIKNKRNYLPTIRFPDIPEKLSDIYIISSYTDRLDNLAWQYYKDPTLWWIIAEANVGISKGSLLIPAGKQIRIPIEIIGIIEEYKFINNIKI